ncbi:hypothetical protein [Fulvivirga sp.]|uniref:hypothetical protein n=1 Tax=Fulvivirga sp. TaxID=1931237 RepID=UPI0032EB0080
MKRITKLLAFGLFAAMTTLTSCIDNEVAPEVTRLREAQASYVEAEARLTAALALQEEIEAAMDSVQLQRDIAALEVYLAEQELLLEQAIDELAEYLAEHGLEKAQEYLDLYADAMGEVYDLNYDVLDQVALLQDYTDLDQNGTNYAQITERIQRDLDLEIAELALWEGILAEVEAAQDDPAVLADQLPALYADLETLNNQIEAADRAADEYEVTNVAPAYDAYQMLIGGSSWWGNEDFKDPGAELEDAKNDVINAEDNIRGYEEDIVDINELITYFTGLRDAAVADLAALTTEATARRTTANGLLTARDAAEAALASAQTDLDLANLGDDQALQDYFDAVDASNDADNDVANAENDRDIAEQDLVDAQFAVTNDKPTYVTNRDAAQTNVATETTNVANAQAAYDAPNGATQANLDALNAARAALAAAQADLEFWQGLIDDVDEDLADATAALPVAEAALTAALAAQTAADAQEIAAENAYLAALDAIDPVIDAYDAADDAYDAAFDAWSEANNIANAAENLRNNKQNSVDGYNFTLNSLEDDLFETTNNLGEAQGELAEAQGRVTLWEPLASATEADVAAAYQLYLEEEEIWNDLYDVADALEDQYDAADYLVDVIEDQLDDINSVIEDVLNEIENLEDNITSLQEDLSDNMIDEQEWNDIIAAEQQELEALQQELASWEALAAEYLALMNAAIAG